METKQIPAMKFMVTHYHRYGSSEFFVACDHVPSEEEIIKYCDICYEEDRSESIDIVPLNDLDFIIIPD